MKRAFTSIAFSFILSGCSGNSSFVPTTTPQTSSEVAGASVYDASTMTCAVSYEGVVWYTIPAGSFSPIDVQKTQCAAHALTQAQAPPIPAWAKPQQPTQAIFVATSLQEGYSLGGMQALAQVAQAHHVPVSWLIGNGEYIDANASLYNSYHASNGDDVEVEHSASLMQSAQVSFPWYVPTVSAEGAGHERNLAGETAFWGIAWNSHGIDGTYDYGAPWGSYCADTSSYKRPDPSGACSLLGFEWTARDLTRAYLSGHEEYFSTDPDDLQQRAGFSAADAAQYEREMMDAYAAAGEAQPIVVMSQQESDEMLNVGDAAIMDALYGQVVSDGMKTMTLAQAATTARAFSAAPRAIAFPFIAGGMAVPSFINEERVYPATIDYHDTQSGMTFLAGHLLPTRLFRYADYPQSAFNEPLSSVSSTNAPILGSASVGNGSINLHFQAPEALRYGVAFWSSPSSLGLSGPGVTFAGRAGAVVTFNLQAGANDIVIPCSACNGSPLIYST